MYISRFFKETLRNKFSFYPAVLSMASSVPLVNRWVWPGLFSLSLLRASLVMAKEWEEAFFWPIAAKVICFVIHRGPELQCIYLEGIKNSPKILWEPVTEWQLYLGGTGFWLNAVEDDSCTCIEPVIEWQLYLGGTGFWLNAVEDDSCTCIEPVIEWQLYLGGTGFWTNAVED